MKRIWFIILLAFGATYAEAKRPAPPVVEPVTVDGVRYSVATERTETQFSAYVLAEQLSDSRLLSKTPLYRIRYESSREKDVQEIFPVSLEIKGTDVLVEDENGRGHRVTVRERE
jgi:hypothetical protein